MQIDQFEYDKGVSLVAVDENGREMGTVNKIEAHTPGGQLHRAVSIFIVNSMDQILIQQRSMQKSHAPGAWSNSCCSHPGCSETPMEKAKETLKRELGVECEIREVFTMVLKTNLGHGHGENEYDHVFFGKYDGLIMPNPRDVAQCKWVNIAEMKREIGINPDKYSTVLKSAFDRIVQIGNSEKADKNIGKIRS
ncbi:MAG: isopentenyl-diphosphate Delta-isomerase [Candidatus Micrarchaeota archaeon]|nr:isopentenyl-diphosphate Delta-isomerase [Candidatus Micrarchaeota archaeon]MDE1848156.1 isopentenyl-diphosphate Delta-isomerase [Candidatus Micrarchaeota archaeon]MDE1864116.1 isopentenyl-diphosphate Delta-isomerase [Candidatus Micrarchaeota archaeon]